MEVFSAVWPASMGCSRLSWTNLWRDFQKLRLQMCLASLSVSMCLRYYAKKGTIKCPNASDSGAALMK